METREYTAVYDTEAMKNVRYSFKSLNVNNAIAYCSSKIEKGASIVLHDDTNCLALKGPVVKTFINE